MKTRTLKQSDMAAKAAGEILKNGGIVAFPTDTVYGLGAVYTDTEAVAEIFRAKGRDEGKPLSILISDAKDVRLLSDNIPERAWKLFGAFWPGALTVIVEKNDSVPGVVAAGGSTVGIRMPASDIARKIIKEAGSPLAAPSANTSGKRSAVTAEEVSEDLDGKIDMIVDGGACPVGLSSTVVDITGEEIRILRTGSISRADIEEALGK